MGRALEDIRGQEAAVLLDVVQQLSFAREIAQIGAVVKVAARQLLSADGVTFVLREQDSCVHVDEDAIAPLWKGQRFPVNICVSGWAMTHREVVIIEDVDSDPRVPHDAYSDKFVKSLLLVPIRRADPLGAIGACWARRRRPDEREVALLEALAAATATAMANAELYRQLEDAVRLRDELLAVAAHELRTPLTPLRLQLDRLAGAVTAGLPGAEIAARIEQSRHYLERTERLVESLLDQSRMSRDRLQLERSPCDLAAIVTEVVERARRRAPSGGLSRAERARCPLCLQAEGPLEGSWDARRLDQAIEHLLGNALKFGQGRPIEVRVRAEDDAATVSVTDHGIGIAAEDRERIFERFARAVPTSNFGGFGLGLWAARRIVAAHGGALSVESRLEEGSTFTVRLPRTGDME
jgi:signal transduction histidine kinase